MIYVPNATPHANKNETHLRNEGLEMRAKKLGILMSFSSLDRSNQVDNFSLIGPGPSSFGVDVDYDQITPRFLILCSIAFGVFSLVEFIIGGFAPLFIPYFFINLGVSVLSLSPRVQGVKTRWIVGILCLVVLSVYKTALLFPRVTEGWGIGVKMMLYCQTALLECSNAALIIGGEKFRVDLLNINTIKKAVMQCVVPSSVAFREKKPSGIIRR